ncbi:MAG TPA: hypothetical protein PLN96_03020 [Zoogloea sp.]|uniref:hypothetical protein n=1 Tax=Zoogloea sp. TaxID=49181 RepID=UPI002CFB5F33|nr:hypothetical protein [Zoogloea sp.]HMY50826.1 hypothetical protein [Rhodocyclaceae bacterium]HNC91685.1 hypothetical protein [Anaerolineales bacterium]HMZ76452.1 hypothetical protein [Rhodocyclaceae bacterium]HNA68648.1 hypothetical protein [Rhodocyclaceae bacterium]HNB65586.1 hypothetical protein [Rhodocyclaceae bacterium]
MAETDRDLGVAAAAIEAMASTKKLSEFKSFWESFLFRLERAWERNQRRVQTVPGRDAKSWLSTNAKLRRSDPLLNYLKQARNAEVHAISSSIESELIVSVADRFGRPFSMKDMSLSIEGATFVIDLTSTDIGLEWYGDVALSEPKLQCVINRGKRYDPPTRHLGNAIQNHHPVAISILGLNFYKGTYAALGALLNHKKP